MNDKKTPTFETALIYKNVLQNMQDAVIAIDFDGKIITHNPAVITLFDLEEKELTGEHFTTLFLKFIADPRNDDLNDAIFSAIYESNITHNKDVKYYCGDICKHLLVSSTVLFSDKKEKERLGMILVITDITERQHLLDIQNLFGKYIDPRIANRLLSMNQNELIEPDRRVLTVSFCDMNDFTKLCEGLSPVTMEKLMNIFFTKLSHVVHKNDGVIDKFIGDAIMSFWGSPFTDEGKHSTCACQAALEQIACIDDLNNEIHALNEKDLENVSISIHIGIATGELVVANIGSDEYKSFTIMGNKVNLAARLVGANKIYGTKILLSDEVVNSAGPKFEYREIDKIQVKGQETHITIYELLGRKNSLTDLQSKFLETYANALALYRQRQWSAAEHTFEQALQLVPNDAPSIVFLERIVNFKNHPPNEHWDGVWVLDRK